MCRGEWKMGPYVHNHGTGEWRVDRLQFLPISLLGEPKIPHIQSGRFAQDVSCPLFIRGPVLRSPPHLLKYPDAYKP
jgi:hypothetical protein